LLEEIDRIAVSKNITSAQVALAWLLARKPDIAMIPGTRKVPYLEQNWQAMELDLSSEELNSLNQFSSDFVAMGERY